VQVYNLKPPSFDIYFHILLPWSFLLLEYCSWNCRWQIERQIQTIMKNSWHDLQEQDCIASISYSHSVKQIRLHWMELQKERTWREDWFNQRNAEKYIHAASLSETPWAKCQAGEREAV
jgi:hypothetical protein